MKTLETCSPLRMAPQKLLSEERLDIAVKWMFFQHLLKGNNRDSERIYRWHIEKRTGGRERRSWKNSIEDYITACKDLLASMLNYGFDPNCPLKYGQDGRLRSGAHRLACSLLLGLDIHYIIVAINGGKPWGENWFVNHGIAPEDLQRIKADWEWLRHRYE